MKRNRLTFHIALLVLGIVGLAAGILAAQPESRRPLANRSEASCPEDWTRPKATISVGTLGFQAELVKSPCAQERGLSGRDPVPAQGMLFAFPHDNRWAFWMKDMLVPIDIVWIASDGRVVSVLSSVSPDTYPDVFRPDSDARYVWELPAGEAERIGIVPGSRLSFNQIP